MCLYKYVDDVLQTAVGNVPVYGPCYRKYVQCMVCLYVCIEDAVDFQCEVYLYTNKISHT